MTMSKMLLKLTGIIALAFACVYIVSYIAINLIIPYNYLTVNYDYVLLLILAIFSLITAFGGIIFLHYKDLPINKLKEKKDVILIWSIILFVTTGICGLIGLVVYALLAELFQVNNKVGYIEELAELKKLLDKGLITKDEFESKKKKILDI
jgi:membrane protease YdiL (CAAX protease family)